MAKHATYLFLAALLGAAACGCGGGRKTDAVNIALNKAAVASSNYDYNLTAQLVTDGVVDSLEPAWLKVSTSAGELPKREKEWTVDHGPYSRATLDGPSDFLEYEWSARTFSAGCVRIVGTVAYREPAKGPWSVRCLAGSDSLQAVGEVKGRGMPGRPYGKVLVDDPNKETGQAECPVRLLEFSIPLKEALDFNRFRVEFQMDSALFWEIASVDFSQKGYFPKSRDTGPYADKDSRGFNVLPSMDFSSVWMSADDSPQWITVDLGSVSKFVAVNVHWIHKAALSYIETSEDGSKWKKVMVVPPCDSLLSIAPVKKGEGRYVRLNMSGADSSGHFAVSEIEVIGLQVPDAGGLAGKVKDVAVQAGRSLLEGDREAAGDAITDALSFWQVQRASKVEGSGEDISSPGYNSLFWLPAVVPGAVLGSYVAARAVPDPAFSDNMQQISESFFGGEFWYRGMIPLQKDTLRRTLLCFDGINWKAEVFLNGSRLGDIAGAFRSARFDVTDIAVNGENFLAVKIIPPAHPGAVKEKDSQSPDFNGGELGADNPTFHATVGWDWIPTVRGRDVGIWNDVRFIPSEDVLVSNPLVQSKVTDTLATITPSVDLENLTGSTVKGTILGTVDSISFSKEVILRPGEKKQVVFSPREFPELRNRAFGLWWPAGYGDPVLHDATYSFIPEGREAGDSTLLTLSYKAGIREFTYSGARTDLKIYINGRRFFPKGGNWGFSEFLLRYGDAEYDRAVALHREMNLNMIRNWVGQTGSDAFYQACDKYGIVVWQDFWLANPADGPDPDDFDMFEDNARDYVSRIRSHPCIGLYCGRNEGNPPALLGSRLSRAVGELHPGILYIPNSAEGGVSGHGPYRAVDPDSYFSIPAGKFHTERGMPAMMEYPSLVRTVGEDHLWPNDDVWGQHDFTMTGAQGDATFMQMVRDGFGEEAMKDAESFCSAAQFINHEGYRAMYEANNVARKGLLIWMSHSAWPSLAWQTYDYFFDRTWAFEGVKKACEPLHVQFNPVTMQVQVVNSSCGRQDSLSVRISVTDLEDEEVFAAAAEVSLGEDMTVDAIDCSGVPDGPCTMTLTLEGKYGSILSENVYFRNFKDGKNTGDYRELAGKIKKFQNKNNGDIQP